MDAELKSFLLQILRNQAEISAKLCRINAALELNDNEALTERKDEIDERIAALKFNISLQAREILENQVYDDVEIQYHLD